MADTTTQGGAAATATQTADTGFVGGFAPGHLEALIPGEVEVPDEPTAAAPPAEKPTPLAEIIRAQREERESRQRAEQDRATAATKLAEVEAELTRLKAGDDPLGDPVGWAQARKMSKDQQALFAQALLYDIVPDKAPNDLRFKLFEAKTQREKAAAEAARAQDAEKQRQAGETNQIQAYVASIDAAAKSFTAGSYPESEAWFDGDHDTYVRSLFATANNLAEAARRTNKVADLSPSAVAKALEADVAARMTRRDERRAGASTKQKVAPAPAAQQAAIDTTSTKGLGAGSPRPKAMTDEERVARATAAAFRTR